MSGPEVPFPLRVRVADRLHQLSVDQRQHVIAQASARVNSKAKKGNPSLRDQAIVQWAVLNKLLG